MRYALAPWEDAHAIRRIERYDAASEEIRAGEQRDRRADVAKRRLSILLAPLAGLLPGRTQKRMHRDFGAPAVGMTVASAAPLFLAGFLGLVGALVGVAGARLDLPVWIAPPAAVAMYLFVESALRLASALAGGEPMGTLAAEVALALRRPARAPGPATGAAVPGSGTPPLPAAAGGSEEEAARDLELFRVLEPLLALLPPADQDRLAARFGFDALGRGRRTAIVLLAAAALNTAVSLSSLARPGGAFAEVLWSLPAVFLAAEQVGRLRRLRAGRPAGSVLGCLVRPFAKPLLAPPGSAG